MRAVVLAAGEGSRMWPLAEDRPKHLLPVGGKPILANTLQALAQSLIHEVFVVIGFRGELIRSALGDGARQGLHVEYLHQPRRTGTAAALRLAYEAVGREPFLAVYGDLWIDPSAMQMVLDKAHDSSRVMGVVRVPKPSEYGVVELEGDKVVGISEKPRKHLREGWVNAGIYVLDAEVFEAINRTGVSRRAEYELTSSLQNLLKQGKEIRAATIAREDWLDIGRPWDLLEANERALTDLPHRVKGLVEQEVVLKGPVWLEEDASVRSGSYIEGPVYIGRGAKIGPNARVRPSSCIGEDAAIGTSCEIKNSIIMNGTKIPHLSYVGDSIIGENCNLGAGTITANVRFDEEAITIPVKGRLQSTGREKLGVMMGDAVHTGINVSIMPGVRIGARSWVGAGAVVSEDVPSGHGVFLHQTTIRRRLKKSPRRPHIA